MAFSSDRRRKHEAPAWPATVAVVMACIGFYNGLVIPAAGQDRHIAFAALWGVLGVASGIRAVTIAGNKRGAAFCGWFGIIVAGLGLAMLLYQTMVIVTNGLVPPPFWAPYAHR
jgi:hypothetical protein